MTHAADPSLWTGLATLMGVRMVTVTSPGPNFVATVHAAVSGSRRDGLPAAAGLSTGCVIWCVATLSGLGLAFRSAPWLYRNPSAGRAQWAISTGRCAIWMIRLVAPPKIIWRSRLWV